MTKLSENSLVKQFGKKATVIVEVSGDKDGIYARQTEKAQAASAPQQQAAALVQEQLVARREQSFER